MEDQNAEPLAIKPSTVPKYLDCGLTVVYSLIKSGQLRTIPFGSDRRVLFEDVKKLAAEGWQRPR